nr:uncharacterized protein LOC123772853 [Procambarus clarkii]XP_045622149.1 uncharacterized protein LOC123772853 [Procambarus clarkii]XP_045622150.1 uncharacterized protein LOC123772853 [Procambarus clarkii]XP_045622151.1 uncharacterized protein LOC123772853 [Procambarus clarkii]
MAEEPCKCPENMRETLPLAAREAAMEGRVQHVRAWLNAGGDVNATTTVSDKLGPGMSLLAAACYQGQAVVVRELLKNPMTHLNTRHDTECGMNCTPMYIAAHSGYDDCVSVLLTSKLKCHIDLSVPARIAGKVNMTAIMAAAAQRHWKVVWIILDVYVKMTCEEADFVITKAADNNQWDIVHQVLRRNLPLPTKTFKSLIQRADDQGLWESVFTVLQQNFRYKDECLCEVLSKMVTRRHWKRITELLTLVDTKFDEALAKAALAEDLEEVRNTIKKYDEETLDGTRLVVAAGGTSDEVAYLLYRSYCTGKDVVYKNSLLLAAMNGHLEILMQLFDRHLKYYTYSFLSRARHLAAEGRFEDTEKLLQTALSSKAKSMCS